MNKSLRRLKLTRNRKSATANRLPPGSLGLPVIGETLSFVKNRHLFFETRVKKYGTVFKTRILGDNVVCFVGPEAFSFFVNQPSFDREGANPRHVQRLFYQQSLPLVDGDKHRELREPALQAFSHQVLQVYVQIIEGVTLG